MPQEPTPTTDEILIRGIAALCSCTTVHDISAQAAMICRLRWPDAPTSWLIAEEQGLIIDVSTDPVLWNDPAFQSLLHVVRDQAGIVKRRTYEASAWLTVIEAIEQATAEDVINSDQLQQLLRTLAQLAGIPSLALYLMEESTQDLVAVAAASVTGVAGAPPLLTLDSTAAVSLTVPPHWHVRPLRSRDSTLHGLLLVAVDEQKIPPATVDILDFLGRAIANAREQRTLTRARQRTLDQMTALHGLSLAVNSRPLPLQFVMNLTAAGMRELSGAETVHIIVRRAPFDVLELYSDDGSIVALPAPLAARQPEIPTDGRPRIHHGRPATITIPLQGLPAAEAAVLLTYSEYLPTSADTEMLLLYAGQASVALEANALLEELQRTNEQLDTVMSVTDDGLLLVGPDGRVLLANRAFADVLQTSGLSKPFPVARPGRPFFQLLQEWADSADWPSSAVAELSDAVTAKDYQALRSTESGAVRGTLRRRGIDLEWTVVRADDSHSTRAWSALVTVRDITAAANAERLREELADMIVHDLRSPLSSVLSSFELALRYGLVQSQGILPEIMHVGRQAALRLLEIVNMMLDISRLESGTLPLECRPETVHALSGAVCDVVGLLAAQKGQQLVRDFEDPECLVYADHALVTRVLQNLLDNAVKFSGNGGIISLTTRCIGGDGQPCSGRFVPQLSAQKQELRVRFTVRDNGPGIEPHALESIFDKFTQLRRRREGSGLGLTFCKLAIDAHGGRIWAENHPNGGSMFHLELPHVRRLT